MCKRAEGVAVKFRAGFRPDGHWVEQCSLEFVQLVQHVLPPALLGDCLRLTIMCQDPDDYLAKIVAMQHV